MPAYHMNLLVLPVGASILSESRCAQIAWRLRASTYRYRAREKPGTTHEANANRPPQERQLRIDAEKFQPRNGGERHTMCTRARRKPLPRQTGRYVENSTTKNLKERVHWLQPQSGGNECRSKSVRLSSNAQKNVTICNMYNRVTKN